MSTAGEKKPVTVLLIIGVMLVAVFLLAICALMAATGQQILHFEPEKFIDLGVDSGYARQCSGTKQNFTLQFYPKSLTLSEPMKVSFCVTPLIDIKGGKTCYKLFLDQPPDFDKLYEGCGSFNCPLINKQFPKTCPFRKGVTAKGATHFNLNEVTTLLPVGKFKMRVEIISSSGEQFLCAELHFNVAPPTYDDDY